MANDTVNLHLDMDDFIYEHNLDIVSSRAATIIYLVVLMAAGFFGNILVFLVYYRKFKPSAIRTYILIMSVNDFLSNILALPSDIFEMRFYYDFGNDGACKFFGYITRVLALFGGSILLAVALNRYRKICQPIKAQRSSTYLCFEMIGCGMFSLVASVPHAVLRGLQTVIITGTNVTGRICNTGDVYVGTKFYSIYNVIMGVVFVICVIIFITSYALIARTLWRHKRPVTVIAKSKRGSTKRLSGQKKDPLNTSLDSVLQTGSQGDGYTEQTTRTEVQKPELPSRSKTGIWPFQKKRPISKVVTPSRKLPKRTTLMMFVLTVTFIVSYLPYLVMAAIQKGRNAQDVEPWILNLKQIAMRSFFINSSINPFVYGFCSSRFRNELYQFLCKK